jgi:hypothetical protein
MLLNDDRIEHMAGPWRSRRSWFSGVLLFVRDTTDGADGGSAGAVCYYVFRSPFLNPVAPINREILRLRRTETCYRPASALLRPNIYHFTGVEGDFLR